MKKYSNIDIIAHLRELVETYVTEFQEDFAMDEQILREAVERPDDRGQVFIWFCRKFGTHCIPEKEAFVEASPAYFTATHYDAPFDDSVKAACVVVLKTIQDGKVMGDVYEVDYKGLAREVKRRAVLLGKQKVVLANGCVIYIEPEQSPRNYVEDINDIQSVFYLPRNEENLASVLVQQEAKCFR